MEKILIVEDDSGISDFVKAELDHEGFETTVAADGRVALEVFESFNPDLILLDVMLPGLSGLEVLRRIRKTSAVPVIMVTARGETYDRVNGLDAGADDYLPKPFEIEELLARMRAVLRRSAKVAAEAKSFKIRDLELNCDSMKVTLKGEVIELSKTEYLMLKLLMEKKNQVLSRDQMIDDVWGEDHFIDVNTIDVYVGYLRSKIDQVAGETYIKTVRGTGYMMIDEE
ncbi:MAG: response regulator transcription factor [Spirochaetia bacterium]|nr:response regulator transcription factor [Spirochaetia bacterium]MDD7269976.1 response regulator transcription factor [Treponema sp.]MDY4986361.1 response regulator transcription factor [Treponema sp.]